MRSDEVKFWFRMEKKMIEKKLQEKKEVEKNRNIVAVNMDFDNPKYISI